MIRRRRFPKCLHIASIISILLLIDRARTYQWPDHKLPKPKWDQIKDDVCPWWAGKHCCVYKETTCRRTIDHPVLNGWIDCDKLIQVSEAVVRPHLKKIYESQYSQTKCAVKNLVVLFCKQPPEYDDDIWGKPSESEIAQWKNNPTRLLTGAGNKPETYRQYLTDDSVLELYNIGSSASDQTRMRDFLDPPASMKQYLDLYFQHFFLSGAGMWRPKDWTFEEVDQYLDKVAKIGVLSMKTEGDALWHRAWRCNTFGCKPKEKNILYPGKVMKEFALRMDMTLPCVNYKKHSCNAKTWKKTQSGEGSGGRKWNPSNLAFVELEPVFRVEYAMHWQSIKIDIDHPIAAVKPGYIKQKIKGKPFTTSREVMTNPSLTMPFEMTQSTGMFSFSIIDWAKYDQRGYIKDPLKDLEDTGNVFFNGEKKETDLFYVRGKRIEQWQKTRIVSALDPLQAAEDAAGESDPDQEDSKTYKVQTVFPPFSMMEISYALYKWQLCFILDATAVNAGTPTGVYLYSPPYELALFERPKGLITDRGGDRFINPLKKMDKGDNPVWKMSIVPAYHPKKVSMPIHTEVRLYPICGNPTGSSTNGKSGEEICKMIWFYDANRVDLDAIQMWQGTNFHPIVNGDLEYMKITSRQSRKVKVGIIPHPLLGPDAGVTISFMMRTNDWKNLWIPPQPTLIEKTKDLYADEQSAPWELVRPKFLGEDPDRPMTAGSTRCWELKIKGKRKMKKSKKQRMDHIFYVRPLIFPTKKTIKKWNEKGYNLQDPCIDGFELLKDTTGSKLLKAPGLMEFAPMMAVKTPDEPKPRMSYCMNLKIPGEYHVFWQIGSRDWYNKYSNFVQYTRFSRINKAEAMFGMNEVKREKQEKEVDKKDTLGCRKKDGPKGYYGNRGAEYFKEASFLKSTNILGVETYLEITKPGAVAFEIREFPPPLELGKWTEWTKVHVSRLPQEGEFVIKPKCVHEKLLEFQVEGPEKSIDKKLVLEPYAQDEATKYDPTANDPAFEPFYFRIKIKAPKTLKCWGNYPYKIEWEVKAREFSMRNDKVLDPPPIFLMVIGEDFHSLSGHDTGTEEIMKAQEGANALTYEDGLSDPACIERYATRKKEEAEVTKAGPFGVLAREPQFNWEEETALTGEAHAGDALGFLEPVTVDQTMHSPAELNEFLKDHERIRTNVCKRKPDHQICGGNRTATQALEDLEEQKNSSAMMTMAPITSPAAEPVEARLTLWAWQNVVLYVSVIVVILGNLEAIGCFEKSLATKIAEAQQKQMMMIEEMYADLETK